MYSEPDPHAMRMIHLLRHSIEKARGDGELNFIILSLFSPFFKIGNGYRSQM
jgi:hypothetical protein